MDESLLLEGDLNFTMNKDEIWGWMRREDKLSNYLLEKFEACNLVNVEPMVLRPTWFNNWSMDEGIHKRLDHFLVKEYLL